MNLHIQQLNDTNGFGKVIQLPLIEWEALIKDYQKLKQKEKLKKDLKEGFKSIQKMQKGTESEVSLIDFLNEN
jgi:hypothetical protein